MDTFLEAFGKRLKFLREKYNYTQEQLAELIGVDIRQICRLESGTSFTKHSILVSYCNVLGIKPSELFEFEYDDELSMLATGTYGATYLKVVKADGGMYVKSASKDIDVKKLNKDVLTEEMLLRMAKEIKHEIIIDSIDNNSRQCVYKITPEGMKITIYTPEEIQKAQQLTETLDKLKSLDLDIKKLKFINLAIDALSDDNSRKDLKRVLEGMEMFS